MRIYLDVCCLGRLSDDRSQRRVRKEAEAVAQILALVDNGEAVFVVSSAVQQEIRNNPDENRRGRALGFVSRANENVSESLAIAKRADELRGVGYGWFDALHLAFAEAAFVDAFLTTDDRLLRRAAGSVGLPRVRVVNPVEWILEQMQ
jgi:hypothetical protein